MMGQANVFTRYFPEKIPSRNRSATARRAGACSRCSTGSRREEYLAGDYSIADIANVLGTHHEWPG
jgi:hypothetical protein